MSILVALIIGGIVGWIAGELTGRNEGILGNIAIGIVGSIIGGAIASLFNGSTHGYLSFTWGSFIWSIIGAVIFASILNTIQHRSHHNGA